MELYRKSKEWVQHGDDFGKHLHHEHAATTEDVQRWLAERGLVAVDQDNWQWLTTRIEQAYNAACRGYNGDSVNRLSQAAELYHQMESAQEQTK